MPPRKAAARKASPRSRVKKPAAKVQPAPDAPFLPVLRAAKIDLASLHHYLTVDGKPVFALTADGSAAITLWKRLRKLAPDTGHWPLVMHPNRGPREPQDLDARSEDRATLAKDLRKQTGRKYDKALGATQMLLAAAKDVDVAGWFKKRRLPDDEEGQDMWADLAAETGRKVPKLKPNSVFRSVREVLTKKPLKNITVALWPTPRGEEIPALMRYGGWNACPMPHEQVAILSHWKAAYDADLVAIAGDIMEFAVQKPPTTRAAALQLAHEQGAFCDDIIYQGVGTLARLAEGLLDAPVWYFWWD